MPASGQRPDAFPSDVPTVYAGDAAFVPEFVPAQGAYQRGYGPEALTTQSVPSGEALFQSLLSQPSTGYQGFEAAQAASEFQQLLQRGPLSDFERLLQQPFQPGDWQSAESLAADEAAGLSVLGGLATAGALFLQPGALSPSDLPDNPPGIRNPAALGPGAGFLNPDMAFQNNPAPVAGPFDWAKPETAHPPAPAPWSIPAFNPQSWAAPAPGRNPSPETLTALRNGLAPFTNPGGNPSPGGSTRTAPKPSPKTDTSPRGKAQTISGDCNKGKRPGQCRQGYFREASSGSLELITWSTRRCP